MSIEFLIVGGVIFAVYWFNFWNIIYQNKKQREENKDKDNK